MRPHAVRSPEDNLELLVSELNALRVRGIGGTFDASGTKKPVKLLVFVEVLKRRYGDDAWNSTKQQKIQAIKKLVRAAIDHLPEHGIAGSPEDSMSWHEAALIMYRLQEPQGGVVKQIKEQYPDITQEHALHYRYIRDVGGFPQDDRDGGENRFKAVSGKIRREMAEFMLADDSTSDHEGVEASENEKTADVETSAADSVEEGQSKSPTAEPKEPPSQSLEDYKSSGVSIHNSTNVIGVSYGPVEFK